jgi:hypothetical protein
MTATPNVSMALPVRCTRCGLLPPTSFHASMLAHKGGRSCKRCVHERDQRRWQNQKGDLAHRLLGGLRKQRPRDSWTLAQVQSWLQRCKARSLLSGREGHLMLVPVHGQWSVLVTRGEARLVRKYHATLPVAFWEHVEQVMEGKADPWWQTSDDGSWESRFVQQFGRPGPPWCIP